MLLVSAALLFFAALGRGLRELPLRLIAIYAGIGVIVALHWLTFYESIKRSNAVRRRDLHGAHVGVHRLRRADDRAAIDSIRAS